MFLKRFIFLILLISVVSATGCEIMPVTRYKPTLHNPFPQLTNVAVVPFYNLTGNSKVDGREFARCYANELQRVPGWNVIANELVNQAMLNNELHELKSVDDIRYLAQILKVDAIVIGKIHDFTINYPPRAKLQIEWYSVNPYLHPIPVGYGLPWGTQFEAEIPGKIQLLAEKEIATAQLATQTPEYEPIKRLSPEEQEQQLMLQKLENQRRGRQPESDQPRKEAKKENPIRLASATMQGVPNNVDVYNSSDESRFQQIAEYRQKRFSDENILSTGVPFVPEAQPISQEERKKSVYEIDPSIPHPLQRGPWATEWSETNQQPLAQQAKQDPGTYQGTYQGYPMPPNLTPEQIEQFGWLNQQIAAVQNQYPLMPGMPVEGQPGMIMGEPARFPGLPGDWPDPRGLIPEGPEPERPVRKVKNNGPILTHTAMYNGNDSEFMQALQDYDFLFRDDKRIASKQSLLNNRTEFISFCCRMQIWEMFSARGGAGRAEKVVREWKLWQGGKRPY